jgi:hypothetical protein
MANPLLQRLVITVVGLGLAGATFVAGSIALAYRALPDAETGYAYTIGVMLALTSEHVQAIWDGRPQRIAFRGREYDPSNKYVWQPIALRRKFDCLDVTREPDRAKIPLPETCHVVDHVEHRKASRLFFSVDERKAFNISVRDSQPGGASREAHGATFAVEGEIGIGRTTKSASFVKIDVSAMGLNLVDLSVKPDPNIEPDREGDPAVGGCDKPRTVALLDPFVLRLLPATVARVCRFQFEDKSVFSLVQFQSGLMQATYWSDAVMCRALLAEMLGRSPRPGIVGCLGAHWNEIERLDIRLTFFEVGAQRQFAHIR